MTDSSFHPTLVFLVHLKGFEASYLVSAPYWDCTAPLEISANWESESERYELGPEDEEEM